VRHTAKRELSLARDLAASRVQKPNLEESRTHGGISSHCWKTGGGPLIRFHFRLTFTSTRLAILTKGMLLFIP
jgi:hypothetical protein